MVIDGIVEEDSIIKLFTYLVVGNVPLMLFGPTFFLNFVSPINHQNTKTLYDVTVIHINQQINHCHKF